MNDEILIRFIERQCSEEEAREILRWIEASDDNKHYFARLQTVWAASEISLEEQAGRIDPDAIRRIMVQVYKKQRPGRLTVWLSAAAAVVAVLVLISLFSRQDPQTDYDYVKALAEVANKTEITLSVQNGRTITLADTSVVIAYDKKGEILINDTLAVHKEKENEMNTIFVPYGKRSTLVLSDGSKVFLNSGSSLVYPAEFSSQKREVYLEGEAYFEVAKEEKRKFIVQTSYKAIEVLGTKFNVSVDKQLNKFETVLVTGKIGLDSNSGKIELFPNQYYGYEADTKIDELKTVDVKDYTSWIDGKLRFSREPLAHVLRKLEKCYNIEIEMQDSKYNMYLISGSLDLKNTAEETMKVLMRILIQNDESQKQQLYLIKSKM